MSGSVAGVLSYLVLSTAAMLLVTDSVGIAGTKLLHRPCLIAVSVIHNKK